MAGRSKSFPEGDTVKLTVEVRVQGDPHPGPFRRDLERQGADDLEQPAGDRGFVEIRCGRRRVVFAHELKYR